MQKHSKPLRSQVLTIKRLIHLVEKGPGSKKRAGLDGINVLINQFEQFDVPNRSGVAHLLDIQTSFVSVASIALYCLKLVYRNQWGKQ